MAGVKEKRKKPPAQTRPRPDEPARPPIRKFEGSDGLGWDLGDEGQDAPGSSPTLYPAPVSIPGEQLLAAVYGAMTLPLGAPLPAAALAGGVTPAFAPGVYSSSLPVGCVLPPPPPHPVPPDGAVFPARFSARPTPGGQDAPAPRPPAYRPPPPSGPPPSNLKKRPEAAITRRSSTDSSSYTDSLEDDSSEDDSSEDDSTDSDDAALLDYINNLAAQDPEHALEVDEALLRGPGANYGATDSEGGEMDSHDSDDEWPRGLVVGAGPAPQPSKAGLFYEPHVDSAKRYGDGTSQGGVWPTQCGPAFSSGMAPPSSGRRSAGRDKRLAAAAQRRRVIPGEKAAARTAAIRAKRAARSADRSELTLEDINEALAELASQEEGSPPLVLPARDPHANILIKSLANAYRLRCTVLKHAGGSLQLIATRHSAIPRGKALLQLQRLIATERASIVEGHVRAAAAQAPQGVAGAGYGQAGAEGYGQPPPPPPPVPRPGVLTPLQAEAVKFKAKKEFQRFVSDGVVEDDGSAATVVVPPRPPRVMLTLTVQCGDVDTSSESSEGSGAAAGVEGGHRRPEVDTVRVDMHVEKADASAAPGVLPGSEVGETAEGCTTEGSTGCGGGDEEAALHISEADGDGAPQHAEEQESEESDEEEVWRPQTKQMMSQARRKARKLKRREEARRSGGAAQPGPVPAGFGAFERHTKGVGMKLLMQQGYTAGKGLGVQEQGRLEAVRAAGCPGRRGLGAK